MGYEIYFVRRDPDLRNFTVADFDLILETQADPSGKYFISSEVKTEIISSLEKVGLMFELIEQPETVELNFPTYQVLLFSNQVVISLPFWETNRDDRIEKEVELIINTLVTKEFLGFDPQRNELIKVKIVEPGKSLKAQLTNVNPYFTWSIVVLFISILLLIWRLMK